MNPTDRICNLECVKGKEKKGGQVHEFVGPVKIILVDPSQDDCGQKKTGSAFIAIANMMIGANFVLALLFTLGFKLPLYNNLHILLCTIGYQFLMPSAILMVHALNGPAVPLNKSGRRWQHIILHVLGIGFGIAGTVLVNMYGEKTMLDPSSMERSSYHYKVGNVVAWICGLCVLTGPFIFIKKAELIVTYIHSLFGVLAFIASSVCFILGIIKPSFQIWLFLMAYLNGTYVMVFFTLFYTIVVAFTPLRKFCTCSSK